MNWVNGRGWIAEMDGNDEINVADVEIVFDFA